MPLVGDQGHAETKKHPHAYERVGCCRLRGYRDADLPSATQCGTIMTLG